MRTRVEDYSSPPVTADVTHTYYVGACTGSGTTTVTHSYETNVERQTNRVMNDIVTPDFHKRVSNGEIINNAMDRVEMESVSTLATFNADLYWKKWNTSCNPDKYTYSRDTYTGTRDSRALLLAYGFPHIDLGSIDVEHLISLAVTKAWANVEDCDVGVLEALAEFRETVLSLTKILKRLGSLLKFLKLRHWFMVKQLFTAKELADRYMELRYVLRPLIYDIAGFYNKLSRDNFEPGKRQTFRGWQASTDRHYDQKIWENVASYGHGVDTQRVTASRVATHSVDVRAGVLCHVVSSSFLDRWGFDNIFEAMWETTKFSHVVDWVVNVGDCIAAHTPEVGLRALASWYVATIETYRFVTIVGSSRSFAPARGYGLINASLDIKATMSETVKTQYRVPNPRLDILPTYNIKLDVFKLADLLIMIKHLLA